MATQATRWVAEDGSEHQTQEEAERRDRLAKELHLLDQLLRPRPSDPGCNFANGGGYVQQDPVRAMHYRDGLLALASDHGAGAVILKYKKLAPYEVGFSMAGRIIDDCCPKVLVEAWSRLICLDSKYREWGQGYFALNPEKGVQEEWSNGQVPDSPDTAPGGGADPERQELAAGGEEGAGGGAG